MADASKPGRRHAPASALRLMAVLSAAAVGLVSWAVAVATDSPAWSHPGTRADYLADVCSETGSFTGLIPLSLWLIWLAIAAVALGAEVTYTRQGRGDRRMAWLARLVVACAVVTLPFWLIMTSAIDCAA